RLGPKGKFAWPTFGPSTKVRGRPSGRPGPHFHCPKQSIYLNCVKMISYRIWTDHRDLERWAATLHTRATSILLWRSEVMRPAKEIGRLDFTSPASSQRTRLVG